MTAIKECYNAIFQNQSTYFFFWSNKRNGIASTFQELPNTN